MTIDELLDVMDETLEEAVNLPFTGGKRMVDVEKVREIIDEIRLNMPAEIRQAKNIVKDRNTILEKARGESEDIVKRAEERARAIVEATTNYDDPDTIARVSRNLGEAMVGIEISDIPENELMAGRGW